MIILLLVVVVVSKINGTLGASVLERFDIFMNYMLLEEDSNERVLRENISNMAIYSNYQNMDTEGYFLKLRQLYDDFYNVYNRKRNEYPEWVRLMIDGNKSEFEFLLVLREVGFLDVDRLLALYLADEDIVEKEQEILEAFTTVTNYALDRMEYVTMYANYLDEMDAAGCIVDGQLNAVCSDAWPLPQDANPRAGNNKKILAAVRKRESEVVGLFVYNCFNVQNALMDEGMK